MNPLDWLDAMTEGPWWLDIGAFAVLITSLGIIAQRLVWPILRAVWAAILAAPLIASGTKELVALVEGNVINKLEHIEEGLEGQQSLVRQTATEIAGLKEQLALHEANAVTEVSGLRSMIDAIALRVSALEVKVG